MRLHTKNRGERTSASLAILVRAGSVKGQSIGTYHGDISRSDNLRSFDRYRGMLDINKDSPIYSDELSPNIVPLRPSRVIYTVPQ
eukprot:6206652-Pleurochrysis_carterae.AAC.1